MRHIKVLKNTGEYEEFDREKLRDSLLRSSASLLVTNDVIQKVEKRLKSGMTTSEIYKTAYNFLNKKEKRTALRYSMKRSILDLGPTGFPFEKFIAEIFKAKGYQTMSGITLPGKCVDHEIDVVAWNKTDLILIEVKFHNSLFIKTDTKTALYVKARWDDLRDREIILEKDIRRKPTREILVTNTKFTESAEKYARCCNMGMISWDYPVKGNLYELVNETKLHPITTIPTLSNNQKKQLLENDVITANQIIKDPEILRKAGLNQSKAQKALEEAKMVCGIQ